MLLSPPVSLACATLLACAAAADGTTRPASHHAYQEPNDTVLVQQHVAALASSTQMPASGALSYPYLIPAGPYNQLWDWDSMFLGIATLKYGSGPFLAGSMLNFLSHVNLTSGALPGCLTPSGASPTLYQAKPIIIQGSYLAAKATGDFNAFRPFQPAMLALLSWWNESTSPVAPRGAFDPATSLHVWYDQLSTGADDLVYSDCPSAYSPCWSTQEDAFTLASSDVMTFLAREYIAFSKFLMAWEPAPSPATAARIASNDAAVRRIRDAMETYLWVDSPGGGGYYAAYNVSSRKPIKNRTYQVAWPVWGNLTENATRVAAALDAVLAPDLNGTWGVRSTSSADPRYNNNNTIVPYSNWQGPVWINVNAVIAYTLVAQGRRAEAAALADAVVHTLATDLRVNGTWHESYDAETGVGLAAPGFLSWDTLGATLQENVAAGIDPFSLE